jgi:hypothetical protein
MEIQLIADIEQEMLTILTIIRWNSFTESSPTICAG